MVPSRFTNLPAARARFGDRVDRLGTYLTRGDPLADEAVTALDGTRDGWSLLQTLSPTDLRAGGSAAAPEAVRALFAEAERVPVWVDWDLARRGGQLLLRAGPLGGLVLGLKSLVLAYASPGGNKPLVFTGRLVERAAVRLNETARFVAATIADDGLRPGAPGFQITLRVRLIHARVRKMILASGRWDESAWGVPLNQHDEAGTLLLFSLAVIDGLRRLGMRVDPEDAAAYMHLWRWSGHLLGIDADLLALSEAEARPLADMIAATQGPPDEDSRALTHALLVAGPAARGGEGIPWLSARLCRTLVGEGLADALGVPSTDGASQSGIGRVGARLATQAAGPMVRGLVSTVDALRRGAPGGAGRTLREGRRYWDRITAMQLADPAAAFAVPETLAAPGRYSDARASESRSS
jgi:hypothetical protein